MPDVAFLPTARFQAAFAVVIGVEGGYSDDPADRGNWTGGAVDLGDLRGTAWGISAASYPALDIASLTLDDAQAIYRRDYWDRVSGDALPPPLALLTFDAAVNQGMPRAAQWLQIALRVRVDGDIGPITLDAAASADLLDTLASVCWARDYAYHADSQWSDYGHGWLRRLAIVTALALVYDQPGAPLRYLPHAKVTK